MGPDDVGPSAPGAGGADPGVVDPGDPSPGLGGAMGMPLDDPGVQSPPAPALGDSYPVSSVAEFDAALPMLQPGDEIVFADGTYDDFVLDFKASGTEDAPIQLRAQTPGQVIFHGRSQLFIDGSWLIVSGFKYEEIADIPNITTPYDVLVGSVVTFRKTTSNSRLTETAIVDSGNGVSSYYHMEPGGQYNRVDHCWFSGQRNIGMSLYIEIDPDKPNYAVMESCFVGNRRQGTGNRWETLRIGHSEQQYFQSGALIARNYFTKCDGENEMVSNKSTGNKYLYNTFIDNRGELTLRHGDEAWIEGNLMDDPGNVGAAGIRVIGSRHVIINNYLRNLNFGFNIYAAEANPEPRGYARVEDVIIAFNTIDDSSSPFLVGTSGRPVAPSNVQVGYNLVRSSGTILQYDNGSSDLTYDGNIMYGGNLGIGDTGGIHRESPALLDDSNGFLVPDVSQLPVAVNANAFPQAAKDLNGTERGASPNVGAIQTPNVKPLFPQSEMEVGPHWMNPRAEVSRPEALMLSAVSDPTETSVKVLLPYFRGKPITVDVRDARGRLVRTLQATSDRVTWDGLTVSGSAAPAGQYRISTSVDGVQGARVVRLR